MVEKVTQTPSISELALQRTEFRFSLDGPCPLLDSARPEQLTVFEHPWSTTLYFCDSEGNMTAPAASFKVRQYVGSPLTDNGPFPLLGEETGLLEIKLHSQTEGKRSASKQKIRFYDIPVPTLIHILANPDRLGELKQFRYEGNLPTRDELIDRIRTMYNDFGVDEHEVPTIDHIVEGTELEVFLRAIYRANKVAGGLVPIGVSQYHRTHLEIDELNVRATVDQHLSLWSCIQLDGQWIFRQVPGETENETILEIKSPYEKSVVEWLIRGLPIKDVSASSKFVRIREHVLPLGFSSKSMKERTEQKNRVTGVSETALQVDEREIKIDVDTDPREWLTSSLPQALPGFSIGPSHEGTNFQYYIQCGTGINVSTREKGSNHIRLKYKPEVRLADGVLLRTEINKRYTDDTLREAIVALGGDASKQYNRTPEYIRQRVYRQVISDQGIVYNLVADHCVFEDINILSPLNQLEIEVAGYLTVKGIPEPTDQMIAQDMLELESHIRDALSHSDIHPLPTQTKKYDWASQIR